MSDVLDRLRAAEDLARSRGRETTARLLREAADDLGALEARVAALTESLQDLVAISDSRKSRPIAEIRLALGKARRLLEPPVAMTRPDENGAAEAVDPFDVIARPAPSVGPPRAPA
jgi:hypothetical protein